MRSITTQFSPSWRLSKSDETDEKTWIYSPPKPKITDAVKKRLETKATELISTVLKPEHIKPPPKNARWNYIVDIYTKWNRNYFYFCARYAYPDPCLSLPKNTVSIWAGIRSLS